jgi:hypothetical protein
MTGEQPAESFTAATSTEQCDAVVMGRTSFDQGFQDWLADWPWPDEQVYILTSRRLPADASAVGVLALRGTARRYRASRGRTTARRPRQERMMGLKPTTFCMASVSDRSLAFAPVR